MSSAGETPRCLAGADRRQTAFTVTCNLLSQYLKEKRGGSGISIAAMAADSAKSEGFQTMNLIDDVGGGDKAADLVLFPHRAVSMAPPPPPSSKEPAKAQLTMFYGGKVMVFDDFPADKARDLMQLAGKGVAAGHDASVAAVAADPSMAPAAPPKAAAVVNQLLRVSHPTSSEMPIARSASLHRFFEKRKERVAAMGPYRKPVDSPAAPSPPPPAKLEGGRDWLGLGTGGPVKKETS